MKETEQTRSTLAELQGRLAAARASLAANVARRAEIAFAVETGDAEARKEAAQLFKTALTLDEGVRSLEAAVAEAARRVDLAVGIETDEGERAKAEQALEMLGQFEQRGAALDAKLADFLGEYEALSADFRKLDLLGYPPTTYPLVASNMRRAVSTKLMMTDLRQDFLAPHLRTDFVSAIAGWARICRARAEARINRNRAASAA